MGSNHLDSDLTLLISAWKCFVAFAEWGCLEQRFCGSSELNAYLYMMIKQMIKTRFHVVINEINIFQELKCYDRGLLN